LEVKLAGISSALTPGANSAYVTEELELLLGLTSANLMKLSVVQAQNTTAGMLQAMSSIANTNAAQIVTDQWGICEADLGFGNAQAEQQILMQMALQGQTFLAATGNNGLYGCNGDGNIFRSSNFGVLDPASQQFATAVGGSTPMVDTNSDAAPVLVGESPWNNSALTSSVLTGTTALQSPTATSQAGGGGLSSFWSAMPWQTRNDSASAPVYTLASGDTVIPAATNSSALTGAVIGVLGANRAASSQTVPNPARVVPDVSAAADPQFSSFAVYCTTSACSGTKYGWGNWGGTAASLAIWGATVAHAVEAAYPSSPNTGGRIGLLAPALYALYNADLAGAGAGAGYVQPVAAGTKFCDYKYQLGTTALAGGKATTGLFMQPFGTDAGCAGYVLNQPKLFAVSSAVTTQFASYQSVNYASAASISEQTYSAKSGFAVWSNATAGGAVTATGYNALTGLGSPYIGAATTAGTGLATYLALQTRVSIPRVYMVAQSLTGNSYWLGSYTANPYVKELPANTQWYPLGSSIQFNGQPSIVDDGSLDGTTVAPSNIFIIGPTNGTGTVSGIRWNLATASTSVISGTTTSLGTASASPGGACTGVAAFTDATLTTGASNIGILCTTAAGNMYGGTITTAQTLASLAAWKTTAINTSTFVGGAPIIANASTASGDSYMILTLGNGTNGTTANSVLYSSITGAAGAVFTALTSGVATQTFNQLATTCTSTPGLSYNQRTSSFVMACVASDNKTMYANAYTTSWTWWYPLGTPSASITFNPGVTVISDNMKNDPSYGQVFYIGMGTDRAMYLSGPNASATTFAKSGWQQISLGGIFSTGPGAAFISR
jgi:hypothetical protein